MVIAVLAISILPPDAMFQQQATTTQTNTGETQITLTGMIRYMLLVPACSTKCKIPSVALPYFAATDGKNYRLVGGVHLPICLNEELIVTGWLHTPSTWPSKAYAPRQNFSGDLTIESYTIVGRSSTSSC